MKKGLKVILISLGCCLILLGGLAFWQRQNIQAAWTGLTISKEQLEEDMKQVKEEVDDALTAYNLEGIRDLTVEEEAKLQSGELTLEEAVELMLSGTKQVEAQSKDPEETLLTEDGTQQSVSNNEVVNNEKVNNNEAINSESSSNETTNKQQVDRIVAQYVAKMYTLKAKYVSLLADVESRAKAAFLSLPKEQRNLKGLQKIGVPFINEVVGLESGCDSAVSGILSDLEKELKELGEDTGIVKTMRRAYENEKALKKAYYLSAFK